MKKTSTAPTNVDTETSDERKKKLNSFFSFIFFSLQFTSET